MTSRAPLRVGVCGLGFGAAVHVPGWQSIADAQVAAVAGTDRQVALGAASNLGIGRGVQGVEELLSLDLDVVSIALPPSINEMVLPRIIDHGIPFLCEKPIAVTHAKAQEIADNAASKNLVTAVDFEFLELETFQALHECVQTSTIGEILSVEVVWSNRSRAHGRREPSWKLRRAEGGGVLAMLGSHVFYMLESMFGLAQHISAKGSDLSARAIVGDDAALDSVELKGTTDSGSSFLVQLSNSSPDPPIHRWVINGTSGTAMVENQHQDPVHGFRFTMNSGTGRRTLDEPSVGGSDSRVAPFARLARRYASAVREGESFTPGARAAERVQLLIEIVDGVCRDEKHHQQAQHAAAWSRKRGAS